MDGPSASPRHQSLDALTGLRALAAVWVVSFHYSTVFHAMGPTHASLFIDVGYLGVDLFFLLSGFVIWHVHAVDFVQPRWHAFARFISLRLARLYPVHLFTLGLLALMLWLAPQWGDPPLNPAQFTGRQFLFQLALLQSWGFTDALSWNYPSWSISAEWFCYLLFPILAVLAARCGRRGTILGVVLLLTTISLTYLTVFAGTMNHTGSGLPLLRAAPEFLLGCLLRQLTGQVDMRRWPFAALVGGTAGLWVVSFLTVLPIGLLAIPLFGFLILAGSAADNAVSRLLSLRPLLAVGAASYSLYLMQAPVEKGARVFKASLSPDHPLRDAGVVAIYLGLLAAGTALVHLFVENPSRRWLRRQINHWLPARAAPLLSTSPAVTLRTPAP